METIMSIVRLLTFKLTRDEMLAFNSKHLIAGFIGTWIVGMGRYWDDARASLLQHLGVGSVIYVFVLAGFIWLILLPFKIDHWIYKTVLTFITLTSFPAIIYAIPVEKFFSASDANGLNAWFLAIVAFWRLYLLYYFLKHFTKMSTGNILVVTFMPMCLIVSLLTIFNLHHVVFDLMGGIREPSPHDRSYAVLILLTGLSVILVLPLIIAYGIGIYNYRRKR